MSSTGKLMQSSPDLYTIHVRESEVYKNQVGIFIDGSLDSLFAVFGLKDLVTTAVQERCYQRSNVWPIVNNEDSF
jgi:hypothetical protein